MWLGREPSSGSGLGWGREGLSYFGNKNHMPSALLTRLGQSAWQGGTGAFLKGEGIEMKQDTHNSSAF